MKTFKNTAIFTFTTIAAILLIAWSGNAFGYQSVAFAFLINWLAMSWVAFTGQFVSYSLPPEYYEIKPFENAGQLYEMLGIRLFKNIVRREPLTLFSPSLHFPQIKTVAALQDLDHQMRKAETGHMIIFFLMILFTIFALIRGWFASGAWSLVFNILINGYPIMLQRYNRIKLNELIQKLQA